MNYRGPFQFRRRSLSVKFCSAILSLIIFIFSADKWKYYTHGLHAITAVGEYLNIYANDANDANDYVDITYENIMSDPNLFSSTALQLDAFLERNASIWKNNQKARRRVVDKVVNYKPKAHELCEAALMQMQLKDRCMNIKYQKDLLSRNFQFSHI